MKQAKCFLLILCLGAAAFADEWHVNADAENEVRFTSEVIVLTFDGVTDRIDGYLYSEGETVFSKNAQLYFEVALNTLDTGIGKRDRDMREVLNTEQWPLATFTGKIVDIQSVDSAITAYRVTSTGTFSVHGREKDLTVSGIISMPAANRMRIESDFTILLSDYDIKAPSLAAFVKVGDEIVLHLDFYLLPADE